VRLAGPLEELRRRAETAVHALQERICAAFEALEGPGGARFCEDLWDRPGGGGGRTRVLEGGRVLEKAAVNCSSVFGELDPAFAQSMPGEGTAFTAAGVSVIAHPRNPYAPTSHCNFRFLTRGGAGWFGGGADLTPHYGFVEDAVHFHRTLREACDRHDPGYYPRFKAWCDDYFHLKHRGERRGVGGIFFDHLTGELERLFGFWNDAGEAYLPAYVPIVERRAEMAWGERERRHQSLRRGRYVEFNLLWDRGTTFGLKTGGRVESILASLPPEAAWQYDVRPEPGSPEAALADFLRPRDWLAEAAAL
jgi:coproporphyrinogen III oxidase